MPEPVLHHWHQQFGVTRYGAEDVARHLRTLDLASAAVLAAMLIVAVWNLVAAPRLERAGEPRGTALRAGSRGAIEGWSGRDAYGSARPGMVSRMRAALGPAWHPGDALLTWALSVVGDDRNPTTLYQDPVSLRVWDVRPGEAYGWHPDGALEGGSGATVTGVSAYGSPGYSYLRDTGAGVRVRLSSSVPREGMRWMVMRVR